MKADNIWKSSFLCTRNPKVNYADVKCTISSLNLIISQLAEVKRRIKQFYSNILTMRAWVKKHNKKNARQRWRGGGVVIPSIPSLDLPVFFTSYMEGRNCLTLWAYRFQRYSNSLYLYFCRFASHQRYTQNRKFNGIQDGLHLSLENKHIWIKGTI